MTLSPVLPRLGDPCALQAFVDVAGLDLLVPERVEQRRRLLRRHLVRARRGPLRTGARLARLLLLLLLLMCFPSLLRSLASLLLLLLPGPGRLLLLLVVLLAGLLLLLVL